MRLRSIVSSLITVCPSHQFFLENPCDLGKSHSKDSRSPESNSQLNSDVFNTAGLRLKKKFNLLNVSIGKLHGVVVKLPVL